MSLMVTAPIVGFGISILKIAAEFEKSMNTVQILTGATAEEFEKLRNQAKDLGRTTMFSASQAADAMGFLARAGFDVNQIYGAMPATLDLAAASGQDLATTADQMSNIMNVFKMRAEDAGKAADIIAETASSTNTNVTELAEAMSYAGGVAHDYGLSLEETSAILGLMASAGIKSTRAGTALRGGLARLAKPTGEAQRTLKKLGITITDDSGRLRNLADILSDMNSAGADATDMLNIFGRIAATGMTAAMKEAGPVMDELVYKLEHSAGAAAEQAAVQTKGLAGEIKNLKSAWEGLSIAIADAGLLKNVTNLIKELTIKLRELAETDPEGLKAATNFLLALAALGPLTWIVGKAIVLISWIKTAVIWLSKLNPYIQLILGLISLIYYIYTLARDAESLGDAFRLMWEDFLSGIDWALDKIKQLIKLIDFIPGIEIPDWVYKSIPDIYPWQPIPVHRGERSYGLGASYGPPITNNNDINISVTLPEGASEDKVIQATQKSVSDSLDTLARDIQRNFPT